MPDKLRRAVLWLIALAFASGVTLLVIPPPSHSRRTLEIEIRASAGTEARLLWSADQQWSEQGSYRLPLKPRVEGFEHLRFPLPPEGVPWIRLELTNAEAEVVVGQMRVLDSRENVIGLVDRDVLRPITQVASALRMGDGLHIATSSGAANPALTTNIACMDRIRPLGNLSRVTPVALALTSAVVAALLLTSLGVVAAAAFGQSTQSGEALNSRQLRLAGLWMAVLFLVVFSAKLLLMRNTPVMTPFWDQWDAEAAYLFIPYADCSLPWSSMFALHNEHRIFFTRLLALDLLWVNDQWDPRFEQVVNAAIHSLAAVVFAAVFWITNRRRRLELLVLVCALVFAMPFGWENTLAGFQSAFYFFVLFSILAFWLTSAHRVFTWRWCLGATCAFCAVFTSAGGVITGAMVAGLSVLKLIADRSDWRRELAGIATGLAILAVGAAVASPPLAGHEPLRAHGVVEFLQALVTNMAWPWIDDRRAAVLMWLPVAVLLVPLVRRPRSLTVSDYLTLAVSGWVILNGVAVAYGRGAGAPAPASRYMDFLSLGLIANLMALTALTDRLRRDSSRRLAYGLLGLWLALAAVGVDRLVARTDIELGHFRSFFASHTESVRAFVVTGHREEFLAKRPLYDLPFPDAPTLVGLLENPVFRRILPATLREPLPVHVKTSTNDAFVQSGPFVRSLPQDPLARFWWSLAERGKGGQGSFESQPLSCQFGQRLRLHVSGYLGWERQYLAFRNIVTGEDTPIRPGTFAREEWVPLVLKCPADPFEIIAIDGTPDSWFGFREPVEIGRGSLAAERLIASARALLLIGLAMAAAALWWSGRLAAQST